MNAVKRVGGSLTKATETQLLPITMAPCGYTVEEALALPSKWKAEAQERAEQEAKRAAQGGAPARAGGAGPHHRPD
ncbi:hypothetical protein D7Y56_00045 (plasmid) [Streptomyces sp. S501]|uniref:hypothetical protein n=1 Tax=Streptomyces sp. S501 TaxID=2420135 RepID=UPI00106E3876|nr:hypothetical protein [Streptomyces sp. S501]QBR04497.1 hypothetical protein D7Y56_00045 [Streptomyces sp. S501]